ncbi:unnamed protein product [Allacma fusca]|uniref:RING-type E3 ubiquitin transferase n=1 Tax=Allacma fusca TaxID=39272 RepID=A0A8J2NXT6_9HEXA|nr:unnamed protein product [Allacma fusca]CAG7718395.1 unnamed protein product [Allacma fusca]
MVEKLFFDVDNGEGHQSLEETSEEAETKKDKIKERRKEEELKYLEREKQAQFIFEEKKAEEQRRRELEKAEKARIRKEWDELQAKQEEYRMEMEKKNAEKRERQEQEFNEFLDFLSGDIETPPVPYLIPDDPNFGEKAVCPFFARTATCRFGTQCTRLHPKPALSQVLLIPNFFSHFSLEQTLRDEYDTDLNLEYEDSELHREFLVFYHDVLPEFQKFGNVLQFKVCCNYEVHLRGNVYVQFKDIRQAVEAYRSFNGRYYNGKQLSLQFVKIESWRSAICGLFCRKRCPKNRSCSYLHVFRNPTKEFVSADNDWKPTNQKNIFNTGSSRSNRSTNLSTHNQSDSTTTVSDFKRLDQASKSSTSKVEPKLSNHCKSKEIDKHRTGPEISLNSLCNRNKTARLLMNFSPYIVRNEDSDSDEGIDRSWEVAETPKREDLLPLLECPVCLNLPLPPIRTCYQGHTICNNCSQKVSRCPLCQKPIGIGRNFFAEDFLSRSVVKCKYAQDGCNLRLHGANLKMHLNVCNFRPIKCARCNTKVAFTSYDDHLYSAHAIGRWDLNDDGIRTVLSEKNQTKRFDIRLLEVFSREVQYKALVAAFALSFVADQFLLDFG